MLAGRNRVGRWPFCPHKRGQRIMRWSENSLLGGLRSTTGEEHADGLAQVKALKA